MREVPIQTQANAFLDQLFSEIKSLGFVIEPHWQIDHLCYRVETLERYQQMQIEFSKTADLLIESPVGGRMISTYKLQEPIRYKDFQIDLIELPAPKAGKVVREGFEHIEVVIDLPFEGIEQKYPNLQYDRSGLQKTFNKELEINFQSGAVKLHQLSLESVVNLEKNQKVWDAIQKSRVLEIFKKFEPLVAGTFPLAISTEESDVDVLLKTSELRDLKKTLQQNFSKLPDYDVDEREVDGLPTVIATFEFQKVKFEIFAQNRSTVRQKAYRHFLIEERLLKLGGTKLRDEIIRLRTRGEKTEPAFGAALNLQGNPFDELLNLQTMSNLNLFQKILKPRQF